MDRRIALGLVGVLLTAWSSGESSAQAPPPARDPSAQPSVGMAPIRSLNDSINDVSTIPNGVPMASSRVPTSPVTSGPAATIPNAPVLSEPVSMTPIDPLHHSISHGFGSGRIASLFRKPGARPTLPASTTPVRYLPSLGATTAPPSSMSRLPPLPGPTRDATTPGPSGGRPSPYAGQLPETARPQADPVVVPTSATAPGRPAPYINQVQPAARLQSPTEPRPTNPRPQLDPATTPTYRPIEPGPAPAPTPTPKPAESSPAAEAPGVFPVLPTELPVPPPLGPSPTAASTPATLPVAAVEPQPASLPALESTDAVVAPAPAAVMVTPPAELPDLAAVTPLAKPVAPAPTTQPAALVADLEAGPSPIDAQVKRTSTDEAALQIKNSRFKKDQKFLTYPAATVGDEVITINELNDAVKLQMAEYPDIRNIAPDSPEFINLMSHVAGMTLNNLIDQRLILQDFKAKIKTHPKAEEKFNEFINAMWISEELPVLYRENAVSNIHELKIKMREKGQSYETKKEIYRKKQMAHQFLGGEIRNKVTHDMIEMKEYYDSHKIQYTKPARMTWREIEVNVARYPDRATARKKADELLARLLHNESFEAIAKANSNGPTASQGGIYVDMEPGSYGIASVNDELNRIPIGQVSQVIEAPNSFHIIRVDSRRDKGPLRFDEVQDQVAIEVLNQNTIKAVNQYLARLRAKTLIRTMFENTQNGLVGAGGDPISPKSDPAVQQTSGSR